MLISSFIIPYKQLFHFDLIVFVLFKTIIIINIGLNNADSRVLFCFPCIRKLSRQQLSPITPGKRIHFVIVFLEFCNSGR